MPEIQINACCDAAARNHATETMESLGWRTSEQNVQSLIRPVMEDEGGSQPEVPAHTGARHCNCHRRSPGSWHPGSDCVGSGRKRLQASCRSQRLRSEPHLVVLRPAVPRQAPPPLINPLVCTN